MADEGLERDAESPENTAVSQNGGAESGALAVASGAIDADLARIIEAWPMLTQTQVEAMLAFVDYQSLTKECLQSR